MGLRTALFFLPESVPIRQPANYGSQPPAARGCGAVRQVSTRRTSLQGNGPVAPESEHTDCLVVDRHTQSTHFRPHGRVTGRARIHLDKRPGGQNSG